MSEFNVITDQFDYQPDETATFTVSGFNAGSTVQLTLNNIIGPGADGIYGTPDDILGTTLTGTGSLGTITDGGFGDLDGALNGVITTSWYVNSDALEQSF